MKKMLVLVLALLASGIIFEDSFSEKSVFFDSVKFIQYLDENTALEEVRNGNLDIYYWRIASDRLQDQQSKEGLEIFDSTGGSNSILVNPAESEKFNPFSDKEVRFALNYLVDRKLIVNELMGGYGAPIVSHYVPSDPEFLTIIEVLEQFNFQYNPTLTNEIITESLIERGAVKNNGIWEKDSEPIEITVLIRNDDPVRKSIGELLSTELKNIGFIVKKDFGDLNKAFVIVYGSDPSELKWSIYTEGWNRSAFKKYDSTGLGQMYSPWFSYMPGFNNPTYWNYENEKLDTLTQKIYTGNFSSSQERTKIIQDAVVEGINESVRIFLASKIDQYVTNQKISGVINDFGTGVPSRFTPINVQGNNEELKIGVKQIYQGAWNPIMGFSDVYSRHIWSIVSDPGTFKHPFTGETIPVRIDWVVETAGPEGKLEVPSDAEIWEPTSQKWVEVGEDKTATSKIVYDFKFSDWHNGERMDMRDILHWLYFKIEWGTQTDENDKTFDTEFTPRAAQSIQTIKGIKHVDENTLEIFVDYWHFDKREIAEWPVVWSTIPWEITAAMEKAVMEGKVSFSRSGAVSKNVNWLSLLVPNDANEIKKNLDEFYEIKHIPKAFENMNINSEYYANRYTSSSDWIKENQHAVISNGPFYLKSYSPESRTILVNAFMNESYPFSKGEWSGFENPKFATIEEINVKKIIKQNSKSEITIKTTNADSIIYFLTNSLGETVTSKHIRDIDTETIIEISPEETLSLDIGANKIKIFAISDSVFKPDFYETSFVLSSSEKELPENSISENNELIDNQDYTSLIIIPIIIIVGIIVYIKKKSR